MAFTCTDEIKRIFDIPYYQRDIYKKDIALAHKKKGHWYILSSDEYVSYINKISRALLRLGVKPGDKIALISNNRIKWSVLDMANIQIGGITVPIYPTISEQDYKYIFNHAEIQYCFVSDANLYNKVFNIHPEVPSLKKIYTFDTVPDAPNWMELVEAGRDESNQYEIERLKESICENDMATLIYTSGTTGIPKGVMLSHRNIIENVKCCFNVIPKIENSKALSYLPMCHIFERSAVLFYQAFGVGVYFAESIETIGSDAKEVRPMIMTAVPRVVEKLYTKIINVGTKLTGLKKMVFFWALRVGKRYEPYNQNGRWYQAKLNLARKLVLSKWKEGLGGELKYLVSGSSALEPTLVRVFNAAEIITMEGYGLTETSPFISINTKEKGQMKTGTVGVPLKCVDIKIAHDGEILVKGPNVMLGYYKDEALTHEVIDPDGWFHTGDIGWLRDGFLAITDRKKEMFKNSGGKYIAPQAIENLMNQSRFIEQAMIMGAGKKHPAALIQPDFSFLHDWAVYKGYKDLAKMNREQMVADPRVIARVRQEIKGINRHLGSWERIKRFELISREWTMNKEEITPTLKLRRKNIEKNFAETIERLFPSEDTD